MTDHSPLLKWSSCPELLHVPNVRPEGITKLHIYDFDNTLYCSPHPNKELYTKGLYDRLYNSSDILDGGWWSEPTFLEQSFSDMIDSKGNQRAQYWNADVVELARKSYEDAQTISIVLTGRKEILFSSIFTKMFLKLGDLKFNAVCLKRANVGSSTAEYKISLIGEFLLYYSSLEELVIYEDRSQQVKKFEKAFSRARLVQVKPRFKMLKVSEESRLVSRIFERSHLNDSLSWTEPTRGFIVDRGSYRSLSNWILRFFKMKYKLSSLPQYPLYIPLSTDSEEEIAKIWSNNDPQVISSSSKVQEIYNKFRSQQNLEGGFNVNFEVIKIGYRNSGHTRRAPPIYIKVKVSDSRQYVSSCPDDMMVVSTETALHTDSRELKAAKWITLDRPIRLKTALGHFSRLTTR